jgi:hypothetical protein
MKRFATGIVVIALIALWTLSMRQLDSARAPALLPSLVYLGQGGAYTVEPGFDFIVKRDNPFRFVFIEGPTYTAASNERVWQAFGTNGAPPAVYEVETIVGPVDGGCVIAYVAIDDDIDGPF